VATLSDLAKQHTGLDRDDLAHLQRLVGEWGMLADFCFADLLLYLRSSDGRWIVVGQVRPVTSQTIYLSDWVGTWANDSERPLLAQAYERGEVVEGDVEVETVPGPTRMVAIPVRREGEVIAVLTREWAPGIGRHVGELEHTYLAIFERLAAMIASGRFPFDGEKATTAISPRVGDGVMVLDDEARVRYASPNAVSALHRVGISANVSGMRLAELGFDDGPVRAAYEARQPVTEESEQGTEITLLSRCIPLLDGDDGVTGGVLLVRDVTELRRRDRMLLSKDATIREIHHRVKNNLQTISSLLRLQGRRLQSPEAKAAIAESVRRIRTIALVHETLSREASDDIAFIEIVRPLTRMAEESLQSPDRPVRFRVVGDGGKLPAMVATPLAVVLTELLQNAVDHAFADRRTEPGSVVVLLHNDGSTLEVDVVDDGIGLPPGFTLDLATGLGLSIVRTLVTTELAGSIQMGEPTPAERAEAGLGTTGGPGTVVTLRVPVSTHAG
jgi:two-component system, sensor histidine kinase PdtaS